MNTRCHILHFTMQRSAVASRFRGTNSLRMLRERKDTSCYSPSSYTYHHIFKPLGEFMLKIICQYQHLIAWLNKWPSSPVINYLSLSGLRFFLLLCRLQDENFPPPSLTQVQTSHHYFYHPHQWTMALCIYYPQKLSLFSRRLMLAQRIRVGCI